MCGVCAVMDIHRTAIKRYPIASYKRIVRCAVQNVNPCITHEIKQKQ